MELEDEDEDAEREGRGRKRRNERFSFDNNGDDMCVYACWNRLILKGKRNDQSELEQLNDSVLFSLSPPHLSLF